MITSKEAAEDLGISQTRVNKLCATGQLPATKHAGVWIIKHADLVAFAKRPRPTGRPPKRRRIREPLEKTKEPG